MVLRVIGFLLLAFVVLGPAVIASVGGDPGLGFLVLATTVVALALGVAGSWLIIKGSPPPKEWEKS
jgi:hypothetical protein